MLKKYAKYFILSTILASSYTHAQSGWFNVTGKQHLDFQMTAEGMKTLILSALNTTKDTNTGKYVFIIPAQNKTFKEKLTNPQLAPIVDVMNEVAALDLSQPFNFSLVTTKAKAMAAVSGQNVTLEIISAAKDSFILNMSSIITDIGVNVPNLSICELKNCKKSGLKVDIGGISIQQVAKTKLKVSAKLQVTITNGVAIAQIIDLKTNLGKENGPKINVNFKSFNVPEISIIINDQETMLDTSKIHDVVLDYKEDIAHQIIQKTADLMKGDVEKIINGFLKGKSFNTKVISTYQKKIPQYKLPSIPLQVMERDNTYVAPSYINALPPQVEAAPEISIQNQIITELDKMIQSYAFGLYINRITSNNNKVNVGLSPMLSINGQSMIVTNYIGYGKYLRELGDLNYYTAPAKYHVGVGVSESLINSILMTPEYSIEMINSLLTSMTNFRGVEIEYPGIKLHILNSQIYVVVNTHINVNEVEVQGVWNNFKKWVAEKAEMFMPTHGHIRFPVEIAMSPSLILKEGKKHLRLTPTSPVTGDNLNNTFGYRSNIDLTLTALKTEIVNKIKEATKKSLSKNIDIPLDELTQRSEIKLNPEAIGVENSGHIVFYTSIKEIDFKKILEKK